jgi:hypothetical protein
MSSIIAKRREANREKMRAQRSSGTAQGATRRHMVSHFGLLGASPLRPLLTPTEKHARKLQQTRESNARKRAERKAAGLPYL